MSFRAVVLFLATYFWAATALALPVPPIVALTFFPPAIAQGDTSFMQIRIQNDDATDITGGTIAAFSYPLGIAHTASPIAFNNCGGALTALPGDQVMALTGALIPAGSYCDIDLEVATTGAGVFTTVFPAGGFVGSTGSNLLPSTASLTVTPPIIVINTNDSLPGSLRDAIDYANANCASGPFTITFAIPGAGVHVIRPAVNELTITCPNTTIDGYTQPGAAPNTASSDTNNATILIELDGSLCISPCNTGLRVLADGVLIKGLAIHSFDIASIILNSGSTTIYGNYIGSSAAGASQSNANVGILGTAGASAYVGTGASQDVNLISGNGVGYGVEISGYASIIHNQIGGKRDGSAGNAHTSGIVLDFGSGKSDVRANFIRYNTGAGILVYGGEVTISANSIYANAGIGIDLGGDGPTLNDEPATPPYDIDAGPNARLNYPVITSATRSGGNTMVTGYLKTDANTSVTIELFDTSVATPRTEGQQMIASFGVSTDANGDATFNITVAGILASNVSATATMDTCRGDLCFATSEFSPSVAAVIATPPTVVTNVANSGTGSLRDAINYVNANCATQKSITFNIAGSGVHTIQPTSALPEITCSQAVIDGYSQPGASRNTLSVGNNAVLLIELNGAMAGAANGLEVNTDSVTVSGLVINGWKSATGDANGFALGRGISIAAPVGTPGMVVIGNFIGTDPSGTIAKPNLVGIGNNPGATGLGIGSSLPGDRNVISGNSISGYLGEGIYLQSGDFTVIENNYIGTDASGASPLPNGDSGVITRNTTNTHILENVISGSSTAGILIDWSTGVVIQGNLIGTNVTGTAAIPNGDGIFLELPSVVMIGGAGAGNVISGNTRNGIYTATSIDGTKIHGNFIGTDRTATIDLGNGLSGVTLTATNVDIGGVNAGEGNVIAFNRQYGVYLGGTREAILGNSIFLNTGLGIELSHGGFAETNDVCDADVGANMLQNYPDLVSAVSSAGTTTIVGNATGEPNAVLRIEFFANRASDNAGNRGGRTFLGSTYLNTGPGCSVPLNVPLPVTVAGGDTITATATDASGNTGWFSNAVVVTSAGAVPTISQSGGPSGGVLAGSSFTMTVTVASSGPIPTGKVDFILADIGGGWVSNLCLDLTLDAAGRAQCAFAAPRSGNWNIRILYSGDAATAGASPFFPFLAFQVNPAFSQTGGPAGTVPSGASFTMTATVSTIGPAPIPTGAVNFLLANATGSPLSTLCASVALDGAGRAQCTFTVTSGGAYNIQVVYLGNLPTAAGSRAFPFTVAGAPAPGPSITVTPASLTFAARTVATTSSPQTVTVTNNGPGALDVVSVTLTGDFAYTTNCPDTIPAGATCTADVTFTPLTTGLRTGSITAVSNAVGSPHTLPLSGTGLAAPAPGIHFSSNLVDFPPQALGSESAMQVVTVTNDGTATLAFGAIAVTGDFVLGTVALTATPGPCGSGLSPGASCGIAVAFRPTEAGDRQGFLQITSNATDHPAAVLLVGTGIVTTPPRTLGMPDRFDFDPQPVGTPSEGMSLTITNNSQSDVPITELSVAGDFSASDACTSVPGGGSCTMLVFFQPTALGERSGSLTLRALAEIDPYIVTLSGVGTPNSEPALAVSITRLGFGNVLLGSATPMTITLTNVGQLPVSLGSMRAIGDYLITHDCGTAIAVGTTCTVQVTFFPRMRGQQGGALEIFSNAAGSPHRVQLTGVGCSIPSIARARVRPILCGP